MLIEQLMMLLSNLKKSENWELWNLVKADLKFMTKQGYILYTYC